MFSILEHTKENCTHCFNKNIEVINIVLWAKSVFINKEVDYRCYVMCKIYISIKQSISTIILTRFKKDDRIIIFIKYKWCMP